uniref:Uncharacterized protein n=1 Tax=Aplanochytrium stocchinoi TaxID=215587 RepID=A0A7S3LSB0_9STRA|mmetsp:Transcript_16347/g.20967  ORF Transcript_16347/g.20967 Transcript_16347/m.20967 type:complete len:119 (-) Transcript_16347:342-698(-)
MMQERLNLREFRSKDSSPEEELESERKKDDSGTEKLKPFKRETVANGDPGDDDPSSSSDSSSESSENESDESTSSRKKKKRTKKRHKQAGVLTTTEAPNLPRLEGLSDQNWVHIRREI